MRSYLFFLIVFCCSSLLMADCPYCGPSDECQFLRGDANCDGSVNFTDLVVLLNNPSNLDAADFNDDGAVNPTDIVNFSDWLFEGGPQPACPYPNPGRDCTPDNLENGCSPPVGANAPGSYNGLFLPDVGSSFLKNDFIPDWDFELQPPHHASKWHLILDETDSCADPTNKLNTYVVYYHPQDPLGMTHYRLESGVQRFDAAVELDLYNVSVGNDCLEEGYCSDGSVKVMLDVISAYAEVELEDQSQIQVPINWGTNVLSWIEFSHETPGAIGPGCDDKVDDHLHTLVGILDEDAVLAGLTGGCNTQKIKTIYIRDVRVWLMYPTSQSTHNFVHADVAMDLSVFYHWCTCP